MKKYIEMSFKNMLEEKSCPKLDWEEVSIPDKIFKEFSEI